MGIAGSLMVFAIAWWLAFQALLPFGVRSHLEENTVVPGTEPSAPTVPRLRRKAIYATLIAFAIWAVLFPLIEYRILTIDDIPAPTRLKFP
jgi:predicted secreted protein